MTSKLSDSDYAALAEFRFALRRFQLFSETNAAAAGISSQQHQALLAIRAVDPDRATVGYIAQRLMIKPHTASELIGRLEILKLVERGSTDTDRRRALLRLTHHAKEILSSLSSVHRDEIRRLQPMLIQQLKVLTES